MAEQLVRIKESQSQQAALNNTPYSENCHGKMQGGPIFSAAVGDI